MRAGKPAVWVGLSVVTLAGVFSPLATGAEAQIAPQEMRTAQATVDGERQPLRPPRRLRIYPPYQEPDDVYPRYYPGPNAVRVCNATYAPEYRPSGTVIVPHMTCVWRRG